MDPNLGATLMAPTGEPSSGGEGKSGGWEPVQPGLHAWRPW